MQTSNLPNLEYFHDLITIFILFQDVNNLKVIDSGFETVITAEFVRVNSCQNDYGAASCSKFDLFPESGTILGKN